MNKKRTLFLVRVPGTSGRGPQRKSHPSIHVCFCLLPASPLPFVLNPCLPTAHLSKPPSLIPFFSAFQFERAVPVLHLQGEVSGAFVRGRATLQQRAPLPGTPQALLPDPLGCVQPKHRVMVWHLLCAPLDARGTNVVPLALCAPGCLGHLQKQKSGGFRAEPGVVTRPGQTPLREDPAVLSPGWGRDEDRETRRLIPN